MYRFTCLNIFRCVHTTISLTLCEKCFNDLAEGHNFKGLEPRPWKDLQDSRFLDDPEKVGLYLDKGLREIDGHGCNICGKYRNHGENPFHALNSWRNDIEKQLIGYRLYRKLIEVSNKKEVDELIDSITISPSHPYSFEPYE